MHLLTRSCLFGCLSLLVLPAIGCGDDSSGSDPGMETALDDWPGTATIAPEPWKVGSNHGEFTLLDEDGAPIEGAEVTVSPWMPAHGHGSVDVQLEESEPGVYVTDRLQLTMPGIWDLRLRIALGQDKGRMATTIEVP